MPRSAPATAIDARAACHATSPRERRLHSFENMKKTTPDSETIKAEVRRRYGSIAAGDAVLTQGGGPAEGCCRSGPSSPSASACCDNSEQARKLGYTLEDLAAVPDGANLGLGCGNPVALASLKPGQTVLDLGSGAGFDAFLAAGPLAPPDG